MVDTGKIAREIRKAIQVLEQERDELDGTIANMQDALSKLGVKRGPGRPKGSRNKAKAKSGSKPAKKAKGRKKPNWSPAAKAAAAERMRKYWADWRKKKKAAA